MRFLFLAKAAEPMTDRLKNLIATHFPEGKIDVFQTIEALSQRLRQPLEEPKIAILLAGSRVDLMDILSVQHLFRDTPIILFAPDNEKETIALAHQLRPRFLCDTQSDFEVISGVLKKMVKDHI
jgi:hypothetical protein